MCDQEKTVDTAAQTEYIIRGVTVRDITTILEFINEYATYLRKGNEVKVTAEQLHDTLFVKKRIFVLLFEHDREPVGYCMWYPVFSSFSGETNLFIENMFVRKSNRGKGLGKQLFRHLSNICSNQGMRGIIWKSLKKNTPALGFFQRMGAILVDEEMDFELKNDYLDRLLER